MSEPDVSGNSFDLAGFRGTGYDKGRAFPHQAAWVVCQNLIVSRWWCPARVRVAILRLFGATIGTNVLIRHRVTVHWPWKLSIGDNSWIGEGVWILNLEPVEIGRNSVVSQEALLCTGSHDRRSPTFEFDNAPIRVGNSVWIAARALVLRGVTIGDGSTVGARAVITRDIAAAETVGAGVTR